MKRVASDLRPKLVADDILDLCVFLDENGSLDRLPSYVARNLSHVPTVKPEDMELFCVSQKLEAMEKRLSAIESVSGKLDHGMSQLDKHEVKLSNTLQKVDSAVVVNETTQSALSGSTVRTEATDVKLGDSDWSGDQHITPATASRVPIPSSATDGSTS